MLEVESPQLLGGNEKTTIMPVDFASYLLSSSPPGFDMYHHFSGAPGFGGRLDIHQPRSIIVHSSTAPQFQSFNADDSQALGANVNETNSSLSCSAEDANTCAKEVKEPKNGVKVIVSNTCQKLKKKVSFADDMGFALAAVKIITESSNSPPQFRRPETLSTITVGAVAGVTQKPPLLLQFPQPASDYLAFREKVDRNLVSLENVILKDYNLIGTIRVKNVAFEKTVFVRCTFDSWETHTDIPASYVPNSSCASASKYDTFKFEISVPPAMDVKKKVQFCICYEVCNAQHWDSNDGANYEVASADWREESSNISIFTINYERDWTTYSSWSSVDSSVPYY